ncbi:MAG: hypothetical protein K9I68_05310 [Bacteroidales bacterium]|nr:hypothetical protein [Bacteroidales bacterium]MCF8337857.1 hypothetical protein [Bacteroidales bacterium]
MLIIADSRLPEQAKLKLMEMGDLLEFKTSGVVYEAISGHPDIFMCQLPDKLVVSPQAPGELIDALKAHNVAFNLGSKHTGFKHPGTTFYNAVATHEFLVHNSDYTDKTILQKYAVSQQIFVKQGYTRCNLLSLQGRNFITSDKGIYRALKPYADVLFVSPEGILLEGYSHGFIGGTAGVLDDQVYFTGSLNDFPEGDKIASYLNNLNYEIIELNDGPLIDGGGVFFLR